MCFSDSFYYSSCRFIVWELGRISCDVAPVRSGEGVDQTAPGLTDRCLNGLEAGRCGMVGAGERKRDALRLKVGRAVLLRRIRADRRLPKLDAGVVHHFAQPREGGFLRLAYFWLGREIAGRGLVVGDMLHI